MIMTIAVLPWAGIRAYVLYATTSEYRRKRDQRMGGKRRQGKENPCVRSNGGRTDHVRFGDNKKNLAEMDSVSVVVSAAASFPVPRRIRAVVPDVTLVSLHTWNDWGPHWLHGFSSQHLGSSGSVE